MRWRFALGRAEWVTDLGEVRFSLVMENDGQKWRYEGSKQMVFPSLELAIDSLEKVLIQPESEWLQ